MVRPLYQRLCKRALPGEKLRAAVFELNPGAGTFSRNDQCAMHRKLRFVSSFRQWKSSASCAGDARRSRTWISLMLWRRRARDSNATRADAHFGKALIVMPCLAKCPRLAGRVATGS